MSREECVRGPKLFACYEIMQERESSLPDEVRSAWNAGVSVHDLGDVTRNLRSMMSNLMRWNREKFWAVTQERDKLRKRLVELMSINNASDRKEVEDMTADG
jgi:hypothetical protein